MTRIDQIGAKLPIELFDDCLALYGEFLMAFNNVKSDKFNKIVDELKRQIHQETDNLKPITISQLKLVLNEMLKRGVPEGIDEKYLQIVDLIDFEPLKKQVKHVEVEHGESFTTPRFCQTCREPKGDLHFVNKTALICVDCISKHKSDIFEQAQRDTKELLKKTIDVSVIGENANAIKEKPKPQFIDEKLLPHQDGKGIYKIAIIHKDRITGEMSHSVFEFESDSREAAAGCAVLSKQVKNEIIISIGYEKIILHTGH